MRFPAIWGMFSMILDKVYFVLAGTQEALAGAMWSDSRWILAGYQLLLTTLFVISIRLPNSNFNIKIINVFNTPVVLLGVHYP